MFLLLVTSHLLPTLGGYVLPKFIDWLKPKELSLLIYNLYHFPG